MESLILSNKDPGMNKDYSGHSLDNATYNDNLCKDRDMTLERSSSSIVDVDIKKTSLGHQSGKRTGGNGNLRVLWCTKVDLVENYESLYNAYKNFGNIERMKLKLDDNDQYFEAFITFSESEAALSANESVELSAGSKYSSKLMNSKNIIDEDTDFIPAHYISTSMRPIEEIYRKKPTPTWFVASYKEGYENMVAGSRCLQRKIGFIPRDNLKKYGKNILIKAGNKIQTAVLSNFRPLEDDIFHRT